MIIGCHLSTMITSYIRNDCFSPSPVIIFAKCEHAIYHCRGKLNKCTYTPHITICHFPRAKGPQFIDSHRKAEIFLHLKVSETFPRKADCIVTVMRDVFLVATNVLSAKWSILLQITEYSATYSYASVSGEESATSALKK